MLFTGSTYAIAFDTRPCPENVGVFETSVHRLAANTEIENRQTRRIYGIPFVEYINLKRPRSLKYFT